MAPEEILSSVAASRRDFLKKVMAGTTFAVPLVASFSMEGLSVGPAGAASDPFCANMSASPCCAFAIRIATDIALLSAATSRDLPTVLGTPQTIAALLPFLASALAAMADGVSKGKDDCLNVAAQNQFRKAAGQLDAFQQKLVALCGNTSDVSQDLLASAQAAQDDIASLLAGDCSQP